MHVVVSPEMPLSKVIATIDGTGLQIALVLDAERRLAGVVTDGDIRRAILRGQGVSVPVSEVMNRKPLHVRASVTRREMLAIMRGATVHHLPLVDEEARVVGLVTMDDLTRAESQPNWVVIMAGGLGTRLRPLTNEVPKPLLLVGGRPILEPIIESFAEQGFRRIFLAVNYRAEMIREHFGTGDRWDVEIEYLHETTRLGTAGALSLLTDRPTHPVIVMNGDVLTRADFRELLLFHEAQGADATMVVREHEHQVPYGVIRLRGSAIYKIEEKPVHRYFINAGIYVLSPTALEQVRTAEPLAEPFDMPTLFDRLIAAGMPTAGYPLREFWLDIGRAEEFERAQREWVRTLE
jgi:dTDP-glucose pyrophosphorylase/predicted transcriptional regulator